LGWLAGTQLLISSLSMLFMKKNFREATNYCKNILNEHKEKATVAIHDTAVTQLVGWVVDERRRRKCTVQIDGLLLAPRRFKVASFTMSQFIAPNMNFPMKDYYVANLNELWVQQHDIITPCAPNCDNSLHDVQYFPYGDSPAIFFELNP
jgi:hypothetical protein